MYKAVLVVRLCEVNSAWTWFNWKLRCSSTPAVQHRGLGLVLWVRVQKQKERERERERASLSQEVHWLAEWRKQLVRCFVCASTHGLKLFEFEFEWCTVRLGDSPQTLLSTTYSPTSTENLPRPHSLSSAFFFLLLLLRPFFSSFTFYSCPFPTESSQVFCSASFCLFFSLSCSARSVLLLLFLPSIRPFNFSRVLCSTSVHLSMVALSLPSCLFPRTRFPKSTTRPTS